MEQKTIVNEAIVREIRETKGKDELSQKERAKKYNVRVKYLCEIESGRVWKHVIVRLFTNRRCNLFFCKILS